MAVLIVSAIAIVATIRKLLKAEWDNIDVDYDDDCNGLHNTNTYTSYNNSNVHT